MKTKRNFMSAKFLVVFVAGLAVSLFAAYAATTTIETDLDSAVQYIQNVLVTNAAGVPTINLSGAGSKVMVDTVCNLAGTSCKTVSDVLTSYTESDPVFMEHSGSYLTSQYRDKGGSNYSVNGNVLASGGMILVSKEGIVRGQLSYDSLGFQEFGLFGTDDDYIAAKEGISYKYGNGVLNVSGDNVGIGTTSPTVALDVSGTVNASSFMVSGSGGIDYHVKFTGSNDTLECLDFKGGILVATGDCN